MTAQKKSKVVLFLVFLLATVLIFPFAGISALSTPNLVALGDSTGFGLSAFPDPANRDMATLFGFNDQFADHLGIYGTDAYTNLAWPGDTTSDLLADLADPAIRARVSQATVLTVNIGAATTLLGPSIAAICALWGVNPADYADDLDGRQMLSDLAEAMALKYETIPGYDPLQDFMRLVDFREQAAIDFHSALLKGTSVFNNQWPLIACRIRQLNNRAELYVNTVHNPLQVSSQSDPLYPLYLEFEVLIGRMNLAIKSYAMIYRYRVVDINKAFKQVPGALTFDIAGAIAAATEIVQLDPADPDYPVKLQSCRLRFLQKTDPHPSYIGHVAAFELLKSVRSNTPFWYWR